MPTGTAHPAKSLDDCIACRYVYQKAYVEFFVSAEKFEALKAKVTEFPSLTYMGINSKGDFHSNQARADNDLHSCCCCHCRCMDSDVSLFRIFAVHEANDCGSARLTFAQAF